MAGWDANRPWYHGAQQRLVVLRAGSSITQNSAIARAFSHRPSLVSVSGDVVKHDGTTPGDLYTVVDEIHPQDIYPHPHPVNAGRWEWLTRRVLHLKLIEQTEVSEAAR